MKKLFYSRWEYKKKVDLYENKVAELMRKINDKEFNYLDKYMGSFNKLKEADKQIKNANDLIDNLKKDKRELTKLNKELINENDNYKKELEELNNQITDLKSDRYLIKKIPSGKTPRTQKMMIKSGALQSRIIEKVKGDNNGR